MPKTKKLTVPDFKSRKLSREKLVMVTCYDSSFARVLEESTVDLLLVGDSAAMTMHGHDSTIQADVEMIAIHTMAVARAAPNKFLVADLPFLAIRKGMLAGMEAIERLVKAGAHAVKIEGIRGNAELVRHVTESGIPVMGHLGLTPQFVNAFGGMKVQAKSAEEQDRLLADALEFERLGAFSLVLECVPADIAKKIAAALAIPVIGIGAGVDVDGQVLVLQDLLGFNPGFKPKFLRQYLNGYEQFIGAFDRFGADVRAGTYPSKEESYQG
ncbi:MAG: 3-methyl-2-oxobutanoate hydroxymethyltransferase [Bdellovibrionales bacterium]|nr:3-methyl-2-oxobutanoate hydroxymethyltransferase [Bdellovibrionales bacterium]